MEDVEAKNSFCLEVAAYWEARQENEHAVSFQAVLEEVAEAHSLIALFLGPDDGLHGDMHFPEVNRLRRAPRCVQERLDRRNTSWWLERKAKEQSKVQARLEQMRKDDMEVAAYWEARQENEHAEIMANFNARAMEIVVAALGLRPGSTSAFATSADADILPFEDMPHAVSPVPSAGVGNSDGNGTYRRTKTAAYTSNAKEPPPLLVLPDTAGLTSIIQPHDTDFHQFLRAAAAQGAVPSPPPPALAIGREAQSSSVSFEAFLEEVEEAHCLVALFLGSDDGLHGDMHFPEVYRLRRTSRRVRQISYYDVHWLREWCWLCGCEGAYEDGAGCSMAWRQQAWICPLIFRCL